MDDRHPHLRLNGPFTPPQALAGAHRYPPADVEAEPTEWVWRQLSMMPAAAARRLGIAVDADADGIYVFECPRCHGAVAGTDTTRHRHEHEAGLR